VSCKPQQRIERWEKRLNVDADAARKEVTRRMMAQAPDEAKIQAADYVIDNSGTVEETQKQVQQVYDSLVSQARPRTA
jgi:dephospho-CoA kinase